MGSSEATDLPSVIPSPCFVLDERRLLGNVDVLRRVRDEAAVTVLLALKAFVLTWAFPAIRSVAAGATASSLHELRMAGEEVGGEVHAYAPVYRAREWELWRTQCHFITFNSLSQFRRFGGGDAGFSAGLRIDPEYSDAVAKLYDPCGPGSRFGVRASELAGRLEGMVGFRNILVHQYQELDVDLMIGVIENRLDDLLAFTDTIVARFG